MSSSQTSDNGCPPPAWFEAVEEIEVASALGSGTTVETMSDFEEMQKWSVQKLHELEFDGDAEALAAYVNALIENNRDAEGSDPALLRERAQRELQDFLGAEVAEAFVDGLVQKVQSQVRSAAPEASPVPEETEVLHEDAEAGVSTASAIDTEKDLEAPALDAPNQDPANLPADADAPAGAQEKPAQAQSLPKSRMNMPSQHAQSTGASAKMRGGASARIPDADPDSNKQRSRRSATLEDGGRASTSGGQQLSNAQKNQRNIDRYEAPKDHALRRGNSRDSGPHVHSGAKSTVEPNRRGDGSRSGPRPGELSSDLASRMGHARGDPTHGPFGTTRPGPHRVEDSRLNSGGDGRGGPDHSSRRGVLQQDYNRRDSHPSARGPGDTTRRELRGPTQDFPGNTGAVDLRNQLSRSRVPVQKRLRENEHPSADYEEGRSTKRGRSSGTLDGASGPPQDYDPLYKRRGSEATSISRPMKLSDGTMLESTPHQAGPASHPLPFMANIQRMMAGAAPPPGFPPPPPGMIPHPQMLGAPGMLPPFVAPPSVAVNKSGQRGQADGAGPSVGLARKPGQPSTIGKGAQLNNVLVLRHVPPEKLTLGEINAFFEKFGTISNIKIHPKDRPTHAYVEFSQHSEAAAAHNSVDAVLGNRHVRLYWAREGDFAQDSISTAGMELAPPRGEKRGASGRPASERQDSKKSRRGSEFPSGSSSAPFSANRYLNKAATGHPKAGPAGNAPGTDVTRGAEAGAIAGPSMEEHEAKLVEKRKAIAEARKSQMEAKAQKKEAYVKCVAAQKEIFSRLKSESSSNDEKQKLLVEARRLTEEAEKILGELRGNRPGPSAVAGNGAAPKHSGVASERRKHPGSFTADFRPKNLRIEGATKPGLTADTARVVFPYAEKATITDGVWTIFFSTRKAAEAALRSDALLKAGFGSNATMSLPDARQQAKKATPQDGATAPDVATTQAPGNVDSSAKALSATPAP